MGLRLMSVMVDKSSRKKGGQLISVIHSFSTTHGDPFVGAFAERLLTHVTRPFYEMLRRWIYDGELIDPYQEFFVTEPDPSTRPEIDPRRVSTSVWEDKYKLDDFMIPSIISPDFAKKVFLIGKSLNFIRHSCNDSDWVMAYSKSHSRSLDYENSSATLASSIDSAYETTMSRLTYLMSDKFNLITHLTAIKKYLLLSQGDFIALLMESLAPNLDRPSNSQYRHTLTSQLEHAIRHSNAQYDDPEVLRRLDARMLELSTGEIGWDCFTLEYKISPPCDVIITQWASTQYLKVFNLLWRIKRVEFSMNTTWRRCMAGSRSVLSTVEDKLGAEWKRARCVMAEMIHFTNQLQYYILFEVIESSWDQLQKAMTQPRATLDDLIEAHTKYINNITRKGLLGSKHSTGNQEDSFLAQIHYIRKCMLSYREAVEGLYSFSVAEFSRRQQFSAKIDMRTAQGKWGITEKDLRPGSAAGEFPSSNPQQQMGSSHPREFPDPDTFDPQRYIKGSNDSRPFPNERGYMTFGWGRRVCVGQALAEQGTWISIARLLWAFKFEKAIDPMTGQELPVDIFDYTNGLNMRPNPFHAKTRVRNPEIRETIEREGRQALSELAVYNGVTKYRMSTYYKQGLDR